MELLKASLTAKDQREQHFQLELSGIQLERDTVQQALIKAEERSRLLTGEIHVLGQLITDSEVTVAHLKAELEALKYESQTKLHEATQEYQAARQKLEADAVQMQAKIHELLGEKLVFEQKTTATLLSLQQEVEEERKKRSLSEEIAHHVGQKNRDQAQKVFDLEAQLAAEKAAKANVLRQFETEVGQLTGELEEMQDTLSKVETQAGETEEKRNILAQERKKEREATAAVVSDWKRRHEELQDAKQGLEQLRQQDDQIMGSLRRHNETLNTEIQSLRDTIEHGHQDASRLAEQVTQAQLTSQGLLERSGQLQQRIQALELQLSESQSLNERLQATISTLRGSLDAASETVSQHEKTLKLQAMTLMERDVTVGDLTTRLTQADQRSREASEETRRKDMQISTLRDDFDLQVRQLQLDKSQAVLQRQKEIEEQANAVVSELHQRVLALSTQLHQINEEFSTHKTRADQTQRDTAQRTHAELETVTEERDRATDQTAQLKASLGESQRRREEIETTLTQQIGQAQQETTRVRGERDQLAETQQQLRKELAAGAKKTEELDLELRTSKAQLAASVEEAQHGEEARASLEQQLRVAAQETQQSKRAHQETQQRKGEADAEVARLVEQGKRDRAMFEQAAAKATRELEEREQYAEQLKAEVHKGVAAQRRVRELEERLAGGDRERATVATKVAEQTETIRQMTGQWQQLSQEFLVERGRHEASERTLEKRNQEMVAELLELNERYEALETLQEQLSESTHYKRALEELELKNAMLAKSTTISEEELKKIYQMNLGHQNTKQKIHYVARIKEENLRLQKETGNLQEQLKRATIKLGELEREREKENKEARLEGKTRVVAAVRHSEVFAPPPPRAVGGDKKN